MLKPQRWLAESRNARSFEQPINAHVEANV